MTPAPVPGVPKSQNAICLRPIFEGELIEINVEVALRTIFIPLLGMLHAVRRSFLIDIHGLPNGTCDLFGDLVSAFGRK